MLTVQEALSLVLENTVEQVRQSKKKLLDAKNFSLAEKITTDRDYPPFHRATMDGYALRLEELEKTKKFHLIGEIFAGDVWTPPANSKPNSTVKIMTGAAVPDYFDVIIKREDISENNNTVTIHSEKFHQWMNIAKQGEDAKQGTKVGEHGALLDDSFLTVAASIGYGDIYVYTPPSISLISTGNEILPVDTNPLRHQIRDSNSVMIRGMLRKYKARIQNLWTIPDNPELLLDKIPRCFKTDLCIITGGVSAGDADFIPHTLKSLGVEEIFHKVKIRPGKPIWFGKKGETLFFGLPGNPVSARVTYKVFVEPCIRKFLHLAQESSYYLPLLKARKKKHDMEEYFRVKVINEGNHSYLQEIPSNGSGDFISSLHSDGIAIHPAAKSELPQNEQTQFLFW